MTTKDRLRVMLAGCVLAALIAPGLGAGTHENPWLEVLGGAGCYVAARLLWRERKRKD